MKKIRLGRTGLMVTKTSFGALPIQRISFEKSTEILRKAYDSGINFFDTANFYTDSEEKIGYALADMRNNIIIATKTALLPVDQMKKNLEQSLRMMKTDYIDIYQLHNPAKVPLKGDEAYDFLEDAKRQGLIRHIGITNHRLDNAHTAIESGLYETLQFPFSVLATEKDLALVKKCQTLDVGFIAMKAMSGGLIQHPNATFTFLQQFDNVVPIYGIQKMEELVEWLEYDKHPPAFDEKMVALIAQEKKELSGDFCRSCAYCMPCPVGIEIPTAARISFLMGRSPYKTFLTKAWRENMNLIEKCKNCGHCKAHCPFGLDTPALLKRELERYNQFYNEHIEEAE